MNRVPLTFPLPSRDWYQLPNGGWVSRAWTVKSRMIAERGRYKNDYRRQA